MKPLIIIGSGGHAKSIIDILETSKEWEILGLVSNDNIKSLLGYKIIGQDKDLEKIILNTNKAILGVGQIGSPEKRISLIRKLEKLSFEFPMIASANSIVSQSSRVASGTTIGHGAIINANAKIGKHCIINSCSLIEHDVTIGDFTHVSTGAMINGGVEIGDRVFIGSGAIIREGLKIPSDSIISCGTRIMGWPNKI